MDRRSFASRVRQFLARRYGSPYAFSHEPLTAKRTRGRQRSRRQRFPWSTLKKWTSKEKAQVPLEQSLLNFAAITGVSLDWLVFGTGDELREVAASPDELGRFLREKVCVELESAGFKPAEIRTFLPEESEEHHGILEETIRYWLDRATRDRKVRTERFKGLTEEQVRAVAREAQWYLREKGLPS